jgi:nucleoside-diphosphate-sugar epimerase
VRVFLTGATGSIGRVLTPLLLARVSSLRILVTPRTEAAVPTDRRIEVVVGTLADRPVLDRAARGADIAIHLAGLLPGASPDALGQVNVIGTHNLVEACLRNRVARFVFVSSTSVYRDAADPFARGIDEEAPLLTEATTPVEHYGLSKVQAERHVMAIRAGGRAAFTIIRAPVVYGTPDGWDARLAEAIRRQPWLTRGRVPAAPRLQCVHVDDLAKGIVLAATHPAAANQIFNMAGVELFRFRDVAAPAVVTPGRPAGRWGALRTGVKYDIEKARAMIGYAPSARIFNTAGAY